jgi:hypothetical protein
MTVFKSVQDASLPLPNSSPKIIPSHKHRHWLLTKHSRLSKWRPYIVLYFSTLWWQQRESLLSIQ